MTAVATALSAEPRWMIYGVNGYTGRLTALEAKRRGLNPIVAGRTESSVRAIAEQCGFEHRVFSLNDTRVIAGNLEGVAAVLHCAGPFSATSRPMLVGCQHAKCHYLDITGEIDIFEYVHARDAEWKRSGIVAMPGVGFDVVPSDCLAAMLKRAMPDATHLTLCIRSRHGKMSPGTTKTVVEGLPKGCMIRENGELVPKPAAFKTAMIPFRNEPELAVAIPWGDVSTAYHSTGIPNIIVFMGVPPKQIQQMKMARWLKPILGLGPVQNFLKRKVEQTVKGPTDEERAADEMLLYGEVKNAAGNTAIIRMRTPEGYTFTVESSLASIAALLESGIEPGAYTPSKAFGPDFVLSLEGVECEPAQ